MLILFGGGGSFLSSLKLEEVGEAVCGSPKTRGDVPDRLPTPARGPSVTFQACGRGRNHFFLFALM